MDFEQMTASDLVNGLRNTDPALTKKLRNDAADEVRRIGLLADAVSQGDFSAGAANELARQYLRAYRTYGVLLEAYRPHRTYYNGMSVRAHLVSQVALDEIKRVARSCATEQLDPSLLIVAATPEMIVANA